MHEVLPGLYLASFNEVRQRGSEAQSYYIVNCSRDLPMLSARGMRVPVDDLPEENERMLGFFPQATQTIHDRLRSRDEVIVHCWAGQQRSAAVVAAYLIRYEHMSKDDAMRFVKRHKSDAFSSGATFDQALTVWEHRATAHV
jgi:rhodanese-related sulfurtransferase